MKYPLMEVELLEPEYKNPRAKKLITSMNLTELRNHYKQMMNRGRLTKQHLNSFNRAIDIHYYNKQI